MQNKVGTHEYQAVCFKVCAATVQTMNAESVASALLGIKQPRTRATHAITPAAEKAMERKSRQYDVAFEKNNSAANEYGKIMNAPNPIGSG